MTESGSPVAAILLAAGDSLRMGSPKPLLEFRGLSFLALQIALYQSRGIVVYVVLGREAERISAACPALETAALLLNPGPARGMLSSLQTGLAALPAATPAVFFTPVDNPGVDPRTVDALLEKWRQCRPPLVIPRYECRRGHPVLVDALLIRDLLEWPAHLTARDFIHSRIGQAAYVDTADERVCLDIDTPRDYEALLARDGGA
ncbi:MAG: nucleotidyltransferase family protein [Bryobacteraceae bacterium]|nr:nucleotidyltransferase family protein [Bryobacteraceae bacterium]